MGISKQEASKLVESQKIAYEYAERLHEIEGEKLKELVKKLADDLAPCQAGDYVRTPDGYVYKIESVRLMFENDKPDSFYFQCYGCPVYENEDLGPVEEMDGLFKVIYREERPYTIGDAR